MDGELLKKIEKNTSFRPTFQIVLSGTGAKLEAQFSPPLDIDVGCKYEVALASLETYRSFPNIDSTNNKIKILVNGVWENFSIATGSYDITDITTEIKRQIVDREGKEDRKVKMSSVLLGQAGTNGVERLTDDQILDQANTITNVRSIKGRIFEKSKCV